MKREGRRLVGRADVAGMAILAVAAVMVAGAPRSLDAQEPDAPVRRSTFEFWGGLAADSPALGVLGDTPGMNFGLLGLRWSRWLGRRQERSGVPRYELSMDLIPIARISPPLPSVSCPGLATCVTSPPSGSERGFFPERSPFGIGVNALGLTRRFAPLHGLSPSFGATLGALLFEERVPTTHASALNFLLGVEAGIRLGDPEQRTLVLMYRALHLSNGGMRRENPGVFWHTFTAGVRFP